MPRFVKLATLDEVPPGRSKEVEHGGRIFALFNLDGEVSAIDGICPHQGGPLADGPVHGTYVSCPWHGWEFCVKTGKTNLNSRLKQPIFEVRVEGQDILVAID